MPKRSKEEDEFVLTISDNDDLSISEAEESAGEVAQVESKKRKRDERPQKSSKKQKKQQLAPEASDIEPGSDSDTEDRAIQDGAIDSDFEFDIGATANDTIEEFDGWGAAEERSANVRPKKRAVDVDDIIARRAQKKDGLAALKLNVSDDNAGELGGKIEDGEDENAAEIDFEDENLAEDTFGPAADSEEEEELDSDEEVDQSQAEEENQGDDAASDGDSIASPVAHPDDVGSDAESNSSQDDAEELAKEKAFFAADQKQAPISSADTFQQFSLSRPILRALAALSFSSPTPIQTRAIPVALQGLDVVGSAQTGS
ncbi:nucleolar DEAD-box protein required for synthesis of 60S ribosomal subunit, partial [Elasticomyces elasticus]